MSDVKQGKTAERGAARERANKSPAARAAEQENRFGDLAEGK